ncbi:biotin transporter BioY [Paenibacillus sp. NEAU-GSW1]|uniref:biotin transporter BioY n=1 Tax=Paenibacillus sp. NEAU-GSW1 TaxID=2682486 RepID=UPI0012E1843F|nr:biotin transporter BioY [Paenibacillus sp. NEAU-GSW1]MUT66437.1 ECF transporter S component [Paenibacillus sp. NEAU-GSW1]
MRTNSNIRSLVFIALFAALFIVMSSVDIKLGTKILPFTLQTMAVALAGAFLGPRNGFLSIAAVVALTATGLPLLHGKGGLSYIIGATGGFIFAFPFCAMLVGFAARYIYRSKLLSNKRVISIIGLFIAFELFSSFFAYVPGIPWLAHVANISFSKAMTLYCYPYLLGDAIKSVVAALVTFSLKPYILKIQSSTTKASFIQNQNSGTIKFGQ